MAAAKKPARKSGSSGKAKGATVTKKTKATGGRKSAGKKVAAKKAVTSTAAKSRKPAPKAKPPPATKSRKAAPPAKAAKPAKTTKIQPKPVSQPPRKAVSTPQSEAAGPREMVVRTAPGVVKTTGGKRPTRSRKESQPARVAYDPDALIHGVRPYRSQTGEPYMNAAQLDHFRQILTAWKRELMEEVDRTVHHMQDEASNFPDPNDRATQESEFGLELRTRDRERKLLKKIGSALERIDEGSYGYCEETGEEIGLRRLEARPVATLSVEAQERRELAERQYGERDDRYR